MSAGFDLNQKLYKPERLTGLIKAFCAFGRHPAAVVSNSQKLLLPVRIRALFSHLLCQFGIPGSIIHSSLTAYDHSLQKTGLSCIVTISHITLSQLCFCLCHDPLKANIQNFPVLNSYVPHTIIKIIPWCKNIVFNPPDGFRCHIGSGKLTGGPALPILMDLTQFFLSLFFYEKWVCTSACNRIQFILQPLIRKLRECLAASGCKGAASYDQFFLTDHDGKVMQDMCKCLCSSLNDRFSLCLLIGFCQKSGSC